MLQYTNKMALLFLCSESLRPSGTAGTNILETFELLGNILLQIYTILLLFTICCESTTFNQGFSGKEEDFFYHKNQTQDRNSYDALLTDLV